MENWEWIVWRFLIFMEENYHHITSSSHHLITKLIFLTFPMGSIFYKL